MPNGRTSPSSGWARAALVAFATVAMVGCSSGAGTAPGGAAPAPGRPHRTGLNIVAAENFWGSIVGQLAGSAGRVTSVVTEPNADPHSYETSSDDARAFATADYVVTNGAGYDSWAAKLLAGNPNSRRRVTVAADVLGKKEGDNPHFWYNPGYVTIVAARIEADLKAIDPADSAYFDARVRQFDEASTPYRDLLTAIRVKFAGVAVGSTESIFVYLAADLRLNLISPPEFMQAVAEGNDPPAPAVGQFQDQIVKNQIKVLVYNTQTATAITTNIKRLAAQHGIATVGVSETIEPSAAPYEQWLDRELAELQKALARTGAGGAGS